MGKEDESIDEIVDKVDWGRLVENDLPSREDILLVSQSLQSDPATVLTKMRIVVEKFVNFLFQKQAAGLSPNPDKQVSLAEKIRILKERGEVPDLVNLHLNTLRLAGNLGAHSNMGESEGQVRVLIPAFVEVVRWFAEEKLDRIIGGVMRATHDKHRPAPVPKQEVVDDFATDQLASHWAVGNGIDRVAIREGVLQMNLGWIADWWEEVCKAPYIVMQGIDHANHEYTAELKYVQHFPDWPNQMHAGLLLMEERQGVVPNDGNVLFWGVKNTSNDRHYALEEIQQAGPGGRRHGSRWNHWTPTGASKDGSALPIVARVKQVRDNAGWKYVFEAANDFHVPALVSFSAGPYSRPRLVGIFAKSWNLFKQDSIVGFQAFHLDIFDEQN